MSQLFTKFSHSFFFFFCVFASPFFFTAKELCQGHSLPLVARLASDLSTSELYNLSEFLNLQEQQFLGSIHTIRNAEAFLEGSYHNENWLYLDKTMSGSRSKTSAAPPSSKNTPKATNPDRDRPTPRGQGREKDPASPSLQEFLRPGVAARGGSGPPPPPKTTPSTMPEGVAELPATATAATAAAAASSAVVPVPKTTAPETTRDGPTYTDEAPRASSAGPVGAEKMTAYILSTLTLFLANALEITIDKVTDFFTRVAGGTGLNRVNARKAMRMASRVVHPDKGGSVKLMQLLTSMKDRADKYLDEQEKTFAGSFKERFRELGSLSLRALKKRCPNLVFTNISDTERVHQHRDHFCLEKHLVPEEQTKQAVDALTDAILDERRGRDREPVAEVVDPVRGRPRSGKDPAPFRPRLHRPLGDDPQFVCVGQVRGHEDDGHRGAGAGLPGAVRAADALRRDRELCGEALAAPDPHNPFRGALRPTSPEHPGRVHQGLPEVIKVFPSHIIQAITMIFSKFVVKLV